MSGLRGCRSLPCAADAVDGRGDGRRRCCHAGRRRTLSVCGSNKPLASRGTIVGAARGVAAGPSGARVCSIRNRRRQACAARRAVGVPRAGVPMRSRARIGLPSRGAGLTAGDLVRVAAGRPARVSVSSSVPERSGPCRHAFSTSRSPARVAHVSGSDVVSSALIPMRLARRAACCVTGARRVEVESVRPRGHAGGAGHRDRGAIGSRGPRSAGTGGRITRRGRSKAVVQGGLMPRNPRPSPMRRRALRRRRPRGCAAGSRPRLVARDARISPGAASALKAELPRCGPSTAPVHAAGRRRVQDEIRADEETRRFHCWSGSTGKEHAEGRQRAGRAVTRRLLIVGAVLAWRP